MTLEQLPHIELIESAHQLIRDGADTTDDRLVAHLREIEQRRLHIELGFQSIRDFFFVEFSPYVRPRHIRNSA
jgi:hypothetical protein